VVRKASAVCRGLPVRQVPGAKRANPAPQDHRGHEAHKARPASRVGLARSVSRGRKVRRVSRVREATGDYLASADLKDFRVLKVRQDPRG
jgi:hypothetical protein